MLVQLGPWGVVGNGCLGITEHIESKLIIVFSQLGIYPTSVKVKDMTALICEVNLPDRFESPIKMQY